MNILAFESSAKSASVALLSDGQLIAEYFQNSGQTHSRTLMKMASDLLDNCDLTPENIDVVASSSGPGSFTGLRIGLSAAKGFAWGRDIPCIGVSTLEAMATCHTHLEGIICACMDARRDQVYNAVFLSDGAQLTTIVPDRAVSIADLSADLLNRTENIYCIGDGGLLTYNTLKETIPNLKLVPESVRMQRAFGVAIVANRFVLENKITRGGEVTPNYLRLSQAERERIKKQNKE